MIRKKEQFAQAEQLRKRGFTYAEIAKIVNVSKSTISSWFSKSEWSTVIATDNAKRASRDNSKRISLLNKARSNQFERLYAEAERSAETEYTHYKKDPLFVAGVMLYASIGDFNENNRIRITSRETEVHRVFLAFTSAYLGVSREKVRFWLLLYPDNNPRTCSTYWSKHIKLPVGQFHKYQVASHKTTKETLRFGVGNTIIGDTIQKRKLIKWTKLLLKDL